PTPVAAVRRKRSRRAPAPPRAATPLRTESVAASFFPPRETLQAPRPRPKGKEFTCSLWGRQLSRSWFLFDLQQRERIFDAQLVRIEPPLEREAGALATLEQTKIAVGERFVPRGPDGRDGDKEADRHHDAANRSLGEAGYQAHAHRRVAQHQREPPNAPSGV